MRVVICGGGAIGACTAYFLSRRPGVEVIVVERTAVAAAASGKAGGFLALDWCAGSPLDGLARRSFALHARLADDVAGDWGYRPMTAYSGVVLADQDPRRHRPAALGWLSAGVAIAHRLGTPDTTAIVHPHAFTTAMMRAAQAHGAVLEPAQATGIARRPDGPVRGVESDRGVVEADAVVIAIGPWSRHAAGWLSLPAVYGRKSPSLVYRTDTALPADALFLEIRGTDGEMVAVEVFPRADGSTLLTAFSELVPPPADPAAVAPDPGDLDRLTAIGARLSPHLAADRIVARQACVRPVTADGLPLIGPVPDSAGAYVATGHGPWGILNAPATGEALAELIADGGACSVDLAPFDPARLRPV